MTQIPAIRLATPRSVPESEPATDAAADEASGSGTFDAALTLAIGLFAAPGAQPLAVLATLPDRAQAVAIGEDATDADALTAPRPADTAATSVRAILPDADRGAATAPLPDASAADRVDTTVRAPVLGAAQLPEPSGETPVLHALRAAERGEAVTSLAARVVSSAIAGEPADSRTARATLRRAARGAAIASAITEGAKVSSGSRSAAEPARPAVAPPDAATRGVKSGTSLVRGAQRETPAESVAPAVADDRASAQQSAPIATATGATRATESATTAAAARLAAATAPDEPALAPRSGDRVTLNLEGERGIEGRLRVALRGERVHATLVSNDGTTIENWTAGLDGLRRALGERGFTEPRLAIQQAARTDVTDANAPERGEHRAPREGQRDTHSGGTSRETQEERQARRPPRQQSEKEPS